MVYANIKIHSGPPAQHRKAYTIWRVFFVWASCLPMMADLSMVGIIPQGRGFVKENNYEVGNRKTG